MSLNFRPNIDAYSGQAIIIDFPHYEIHEGDTYHIFGFVNVASNGGVLDIILTTADSPKWCNMVTSITGEAETTGWVYEDAIINLAGTSLTPINNNRNVAKTSLTTWDFILNDSLALANADTDVTGATLLSSGKAGSGRVLGGAHGRDDEILLKENTIYTFRFRNDDTTSVRWVDYEFTWYEHETSERCNFC